MAFDGGKGLSVRCYPAVGFVLQDIRMTKMLVSGKKQAHFFLRDVS